MRSVCGDGVPRSPLPKDECWDDAPCVNPLECFDELKTQDSSALCGSMGATSQFRTSFFNRCVRLVGNDFCVDVYSGRAGNDTTHDGDCAFGAKVTRNTDVVFEREIAMPRLRTREVRNFARNPHRRKAAFEEVFDPRRQLGDAQGDGRGGGGAGGAGG